MQFAEGLTDKQAAQAVATRRLPVCFRLAINPYRFRAERNSERDARLIDGQRERHLFDHILAQLSQKDLLKAGGKQRTDSTKDSPPFAS